MRPRNLSFSLVAFLLLLLEGCEPALTPGPAGGTTTTTSAATSTTMTPSLTPGPAGGTTTTTPAATSTMMTPSLTPTNPSQIPIQLPAESRLGSILPGSGDVARKQLSYDDLLTGTSGAPVEDGSFALPEAAAMPGVVMEGRLKIIPPGEGGFSVVRDDLNLAGDPARMQLPTFDIQFVQDGSFLIPLNQGLVITGSPYWNTIVGPGRIWKETGDHGNARASFPFTLVERNQNCTHNGVMTFLFDGAAVSPVRYQITQETCLYFKFNLWGRTVATYQPETIPQAESVKAAHAAERASLLPTRPIEALPLDFPGARVDLNSFSRGITPADMTAYGLVINGINYVAGCQTRFGEYPYCGELRLPSYSTAKSAFAGVALMRLGQKYGTGVYNLLIKDYVSEAASAAGDWSAVTFRNALDMSTGNYDQEGFELDEDGPTMTAFLDNSETYADKIKNAFLYPAKQPPGRKWVYHTSDTFIAVRAMNNYLVRQEGAEADIFSLIRDEVYRPLNLSQGALTSLRTDNSPTGEPFGGYGLFWTRDDIAKIGLFLNNMNGSILGTQVLEPGLLAASLQRAPLDRGLNTTGLQVDKYRNGFWAREWVPAQASHFPCDFWTPFMSGYGGISVVLMPNGSIFYYFSDSNEFSWYAAVDEADKLRPMCP